VAIVLLDKQSQELYVRSQIGWDEGQDKHRLSLGQGITGAAALKKLPVMPPTSARMRAISVPQNLRGRSWPFP